MLERKPWKRPRKGTGKRKEERRFPKKRQIEIETNALSDVCHFY
jgi:hypothetical protein